VLNSVILHSGALVDQTFITGDTFTGQQIISPKLNLAQYLLLKAKETIKTTVIKPSHVVYETS